MTNDESKVSDGVVTGTVEAVTGLMKAVPIYDDAIRPSAKR